MKILTKKAPAKATPRGTMVLTTQHRARSPQARAGQAGAKPPSGTLKTNWGYLDVYEADPLQRIELAKRGVAAAVPGAIAVDMGITKERVYEMLGLARATVERKIREQKTLSPDESARVIGIGRLVGQVQRMVEESGDPSGFNAAAWVASWMERPVPALGGRRPAEFMDTAEGQAIVAEVLSRAQSGAYA